MTDEERLKLNTQIGRVFFDWRPYRSERIPKHMDGGLRPPPYCTDCVYVVPLAEALRARGWCVEMQMVPGGWEVTLDGPTSDNRSRLVQADATHLELALALAVARAVGTKPDA